MPKKAQLTIIGAAIILLTVVTITYGFFMTGVDNTNQQEISVEAGTMKLTFADNDTGVSKQLMFGESVTKLFTIENTGTLPASAYIYWENLTNTYLYGSLVYKLEYSSTATGDKTVIMNNAAVPRSETATEKILSQILTVPSGETYYYTLTITLVLSDTIDQTADLNAKFASSFTLKNTGSSESQATLAALGLTNQVKTEPTDYNMFDYTYSGYRGIADIENWTFSNEKVEGINTTEGIYAMEDDYGTSYYFRGSKSLNNVVKFGTFDSDMYYYLNGDNVDTTGNLAECQAESKNSATYCTDTYKYASAGDSMYWRIVRINGDGSLRLLYIGTSTSASRINSNIGFAKYNPNPGNYVGYTLNNSIPNLGDGTSSYIKNYLDKWYIKNMMDEDSNISLGQFFSDTSGLEANSNYDMSLSVPESNYHIYASTKRLEKNYLETTSVVVPLLKTSITTEYFGGVYYLKTGLITADELVLSGTDGILGAQGYDSTTTLYPYTVINSDYWTMTPFGYASTSGFVNYISSSGNIYHEMTNIQCAINPVINLTIETAQSLVGTGSTSDPYRLAE